VTDGAPLRRTDVTVGRTDVSTTTGHRRTVVSVAPHPDRNLALAELSAPVTGIRPIALDAAVAQPGETLTVAGYGRTATEWVPNRLHAAAFEVQTVDGGGFGVRGSASNATLCKGDAGGPAFRERNSVPELVGISAASWQKGCIGETDTRDGATEVRADDLGDWIRTRIALQPNRLREAVTGEFNRDGFRDLIAADDAGILWLHPGTATRNVWGQRVRIGAGWAGYRDLTVGRINRDAFDDLVTIETASGKLWLYPGTATGGAFGARVEIGSGWQDFRDLTVGKVNRDGYDDLLTVQDVSKKLYLYAGNATGGRFNAAVEYGTGWGCCTELTLGRFNDDDFDDLLSVDNRNGKLRFYAGTATGASFAPGVDLDAGTGWLDRSDMTALRPVGGTRSGLLSKDKSGALVLNEVGPGGAIDWSDPVPFGPRD
jgi:hypothetical protein